MANGGLSPSDDRVARGVISQSEVKAIHTRILSYGSGMDFGFAPYFGIGIVSQGTTNLTAFRSFHIGLELELGRSFSIAGTLVGRFVNELPDDIAVGSAVPDGKLSTNLALASRGAVVLNLAPEVFKFAGGGK